MFYINICFIRFFQFIKTFRMMLESYCENINTITYIERTGINKMKKNKIFYLAISMLMIVTVVPAMGLPLHSGETTSLTSTQSLNQPPTPGYAPIPPSDAFITPPTQREHLEKTISSMDDIVISMIEQVDESVYMSYLENLTGFGPRYTGTSACEAAAEYLYNQFENMGLAVRYHHWNNGGYTSDNVEATLNGTDDSSDDIYIICGHYDTVAPSPGADDDGSGVVAVLTAAYIMSQYQFNHTIKFVAFSGEEEGLLGSEIYAQHAVAQGWDIVGVLNCDMISYAITTSDGNNLIVYENTASEWLYTYTFAINSEYADYIQLTLHHGGSTWGSDHNSFWDEGYDALFYFEYEMTPYYHTSQDTIAHINATYAVKNVRLVLATLAELAEAGLLSNPPAQPTLVGPDSGVIDETYTFTAVSTEPDGESIYYYFEWGDGTNSDWIGPYNSGQTGVSQHSWAAEGDYTVRAKAKDINNVVSQWSEPLIVTILTDRPPNTPSIAGPPQGKPGVSYLYTFSTTDLDGDMVYYYIDWGDNQTSEWVGPYQSGATATVTHQWSEKGTYIIQVKAKDIFDVESDWASLEVTMPLDAVGYHALNYNTLFSQINQFFENLGIRLFQTR
jgi:hypothetical protein